MRKSWILIVISVVGLGLWWWCNIAGYHYIYVGLHNWIFKKSQWQHIPETEDLRWYAWAAGIAITTAAIAFFGLGDWVVKLAVRMRKPTIVEQRIIEPAFDIVLAAINEKFKLNYTINSFKIYVHEAPEVNAFAFGKNSLCFFSGVLESTTQEELLAIVAHELGHIWRQDSHLSMVFYWLVLIPDFFKNLFGFVSKASTQQNKLDKKHYQDAKGNVITQNTTSAKGASLNILIFVLFPTVIAYIVSVFPLQFGEIDITKNKFNEKRADLFACILGFSDGLYKFLENLSQYSYQTHHVIEKFETHPSPRERMGYVEEYRSGNSKFVKLWFGAYE